jgi:asparagine synthase (glutamine-hydrolysing)
MARFTGEAIRTISIRFREDDLPFESMPDDDVFAREAAKRFGCRHTTIELTPRAVDLLPRMVWHLDEPIFDPASINTYLVAEESRRQGVPVLLSGAGGDEAFGGYRKHRACLLAERYRTFVPGPFRRLVRAGADALPVATASGGLLATRWLKRFLGIASLTSVDGFMQSDLSVGPLEYSALYADAADRPYDSLAEVHHRRAGMEVAGTYLDRMCRLDTSTYLPDHNLTYTDRATMAVGVEARPPLIDHRLIELAFRLEDQSRIHGANQKAILREVVAPWIPVSIARRPKASFAAPLRAWLRRELREMVDDRLSEAAIRRRGLYNVSAVRRIIEDDRRGHSDNAHLIWNLINREMWFETFVDGGGKGINAARELVAST